MNKLLIVGCGDIGTRIAKLIGTNQCNGIVASHASFETIQQGNINAYRIDLDSAPTIPIQLFNELAKTEQLYYLVPPQKTGLIDQRSQAFLTALTQTNISPKRIVLISTTGVYGDHSGEWVNESTPVNPQTDRAKRRWNMEQQWTRFAENNDSILSTLRVPGIYSHSRLPRKRLEKQIPIVDPNECGYTNRIHADDLAATCIKVMTKQTHSDVYNATDGTPGKISDYLLAVAESLQLPIPPIIPMNKAKNQVSAGMLSYLKESRKISNQKLLNSFDIKLRYTDFREGMRV